MRRLRAATEARGPSAARRGSEGRASARRAASLRTPPPRLPSRRRLPPAYPSREDVPRELLSGSIAGPFGKKKPAIRVTLENVPPGLRIRRRAVVSATHRGFCVHDVGKAAGRYLRPLEGSVGEGGAAEWKSWGRSAGLVRSAISLPSKRARVACRGDLRSAKWQSIPTVCGPATWSRERRSGAERHAGAPRNARM